MGARGEREPLRMSRDRASPVCVSPACPVRGVSWGPFSNAMTCHSRSPVTVVTTVAQLASAARDSKTREIDAKLSGWRCEFWQTMLSPVDTNRTAPLGIPDQVMWGPQDCERTESMASGRGRTLPEEGQVCRLLRPCSLVSIMRSSTTGKHLLVTGHEPHEREAPPTPDPKQPERQAGTWERPGAPGAQDCKTLGATTAPRPQD